MTLGHSPTQPDVFRSTAAYCEGRVAPDSIYALLHRECFTLFPDRMFADLFTDIGRNSIPPMIVAVVMVLQRLEGCSDREAVERFAFDVRWKYAAGGLDFDHPGFAHTVLVDMRARLAGSERPERIFEVALTAAREAGLVGRRRVLDSTALYDAVATMDTVTLLRSGIRGLLRVAAGREPALRSLLQRDDDYASGGKPVCDWDDPAAREALIDALAQDAGALLAALDGETLDPLLGEAAALLATLLGQDLETDDAGAFRIARRVAPERIISTVDPDARHGHKTKARSFDGYKGHIAIDPDSEIVTATAVTPGNAGDAAVAPELLEADLPAADETDTDETDEPPIVYADAAYGSGELLGTLETAGASLRIKVQPAVARGGRFGKDDFSIDTEAASVTCPAGQVAPLRTRRHGAVAIFGAACATCPLAARCTTSKAGRSISVGPHEAALVRAREARRDPVWQADYRGTRPKVERRIAHLVRRRHGGRRARVRGRPKVAADFALLAAAVNLARLAVLGLVRSGPTWAIQAG
ncbi:MAG: IS1182 family transposase [Gaiellales bacterium]